DLPAGELAALTQLADGSARTALSLRTAGGANFYSQIIALLDTLPRLDRARALALATLPGGAAGTERLSMLTTLTERALSQIARQAALSRPLPEATPGEAALRARLAPSPDAAQAWAEAAIALPAQVRKGAALNLDPSVLLLDMFGQLQDTAHRAAP
ncbi:MAG: DNA polymerase-3 subunit delta', partial [Dinoroseobacter sp.]